MPRSAVVGEPTTAFPRVFEESERRELPGVRLAEVVGGDHHLIRTDSDWQHLEGAAAGGGGRHRHDSDDQQSEQQNQALHGVPFSDPKVGVGEYGLMKRTTLANLYTTIIANSTAFVKPCPALSSCGKMREEYDERISI
ncbi:MAG: hypothetical protein AAB460_02595 [Patescibacteria group bacterium]